VGVVVVVSPGEAVPLVAVREGALLGEGAEDAVEVERREGVIITACTVSAAAVWTSSGGGICSKGILQARMARMRLAAASFILNV
jgi:hypothetical protein